MSGSGAWLQPPGFTTKITVPPGQNHLVIARFSASSQCLPGGDGALACFVRILVGGVELEPATIVGTPGSGTAQFSHGYGDDFDNEYHAMERSQGPYCPGTYEVRVEITGNYSGDPPVGPHFMRISGAHLTVEQVRYKFMKGEEPSCVGR